MIFKNRDHAAKSLLEKLQEYKGKNVIVAGIPRGSMPMARYIADQLGSELTALIVHKIPAPGNEELAIGSIGLSGNIHLLAWIEDYKIPEEYIEEAARDELGVLKARQEKYGLPLPNFKGRTVIIVDDGVATGATTIAAIHEVRSYVPKKIILATPVASLEAAEELSTLVEEVVCLYIPPEMASISQFYESFPQISDNEVINILHGGEESRL